MGDDPLFKSCLSEFNITLPTRGSGSGPAAHREKLVEARLDRAFDRKMVGHEASNSP